jgi:ProP effector
MPADSPLAVPQDTDPKTLVEASVAESAQQPVVAASPVETDSQAALAAPEPVVDSVADTADAPAPTDTDRASAETGTANVSPPAMSPAECAQQLKQRFGGLFAGAPKPLKLRIQADIQARAPGVFTKSVLSAFLRRHTGSTSYLMALTKASHRFDLDGQPGDELLAEHRQAALDELARRRDVTASRRAEEDEQRRNRAQLLRDFDKTTLTRANFCALKGLPEAELDGLLEIARKEAAEVPRHPQMDRRGPPDRRPQGPRGPGPRGPAGGGERRPGPRREGGGGR